MTRKPDLGECYNIFKTVQKSTKNVKDSQLSAVIVFVDRSECYLRKRFTKRKMSCSER